MSQETKKRDLIEKVKDLRPDFIHLSTLYGVDFEECTITRHEDFANPKLTLRKDVLKTLSTAESPSTVPSIVIYLDKKGIVQVVDGDHRIVNALRKCEGDPDSPWANIRASKFIGSRDEAILEAKINAIPTARGNVTDEEIIGIVEWARSFGMTNEEIVAKVGRSAKSLVKKLTMILDASPEVLESLKNGDIELATAVGVAKEVPLADQGDVIDAVVAAKAREGGSERKARESNGLATTRTKPLKLPEIQSLLWPHWENWVAMMNGVEKKDGFVLGFVGGLLRVLKCPPVDGERQESDEDPLTLDEIVEKLQPQFEAYEENKDKKKRGGYKKKGK